MLVAGPAIVTGDVRHGPVLEHGDEGVDGPEFDLFPLLALRRALVGDDLVAIDFESLTNLDLGDLLAAQNCCFDNDRRARTSCDVIQSAIPMPKLSSRSGFLPKRRPVGR
jgi:hypothetical protein